MNGGGVPPGVAAGVAPIHPGGAGGGAAAAIGAGAVVGGAEGGGVAPGIGRGNEARAPTGAVADAAAATVNQLRSGGGDSAATTVSKQPSEVEKLLSAAAVALGSGASSHTHEMQSTAPGRTTDNASTTGSSLLHPPSKSSDGQISKASRSQAAQPVLPALYVVIGSSAGAAVRPGLSVASGLVRRLEKVGLRSISRSIFDISKSEI